MSAAQDPTLSATTLITLLAFIGQAARAIATASFVLGVVGILAKHHALTVGGFVACGVSVVVMIVAAVVAMARLGRLYKELDD